MPSCSNGGRVEPLPRPNGLWRFFSDKPFEGDKSYLVIKVKGVEIAKEVVKPPRQCFNTKELYYLV